jgi:hypothetical protein
VFNKNNAKAMVQSYQHKFGCITQDSHKTTTTKLEARGDNGLHQSQEK